MESYLFQFNNQFNKKNIQTSKHIFNKNKRDIESLTQRGDLQRADGGSGEGGGGRGRCRWIKELAGKDVDAFALADGEPRSDGKRHPT